MLKKKILPAVLVDGILPHVLAKYAKQTNVCNTFMISLHKSHGITHISDLVSNFNDHTYIITVNYVTSSSPSTELTTNKR